MIRCYIVDDEPLARQSLQQLLMQTKDFHADFVSGDAEAALQRIIDNPPDLIFLDIKMPRLDGMSLLKKLKQELPSSAAPYVVLVTAFDDYAIQAFEYETLDYLVKPFDDARFEITLDRARQRLTSNANSSVDIARGHRTGGRIEFKVSGGSVLLSPTEICWVEARGHYVLIHALRRSYLVRQRIRDTEKHLQSFRFVRVHRSALVNPAQIVRQTKSREQGRILELTDGSKVTVSRRRWQEVREKLDSGLC